MARINRVRLGASSYDRLERRLALLGWLHHLLGYGSTAELLRSMGEIKDGFASDGHSYVYHELLLRGDRVKISPEDLARYDTHIHTHLGRINAGRSEPFTLKYFQYLAALYTEVFLDYNRRDKLLPSLNGWVARHNGKHLPGSHLFEMFAETDLRKLAFWMATGSGKTLIMHINYLQFLRYNNEPLDNILLITPNEGLSRQHLGELLDSSIPAARFALRENGGLETDRDAVQVIEITKLVSEKCGEGVSVPVEAFEGNNLIFVDEGHKGSGGRAWRSVRDALGETGFTFEYSATFGQALVAAGDDELVAEYGKAITFDYSYSHFYGDGYGKDFHIVNLRRETTNDQTDVLLLANLLSFYEQQLIFDEHGEALRPYNLEKPLWVFVGSSVNATYKKNGQKHSDVLTVVRFLHRLLADKRWATETIGLLLDGESGLKGADGKDIFRDRFGYLRGNRFDAAGTYRDILLKVLHTSFGGGLHLCDIRDGKGELGLKAGGSDEYFGLIYIGDRIAFRRLVESSDTGIVIEQVAISGSLFAGIDGAGTTIEILIGAKKFMEGWNSWRVSSMGLLNIGQSEGSQIIQLFGRGVRLRGLNTSLKRSCELGGDHPEYVRQLETLNIFALRANYMAQFRNYLEREGVSVHGTVEIRLPIRPNHELLGSGLVVPRMREDASFVEEETMVLDVDPAVKIRVDLSPKVSLITRSADGITETSAVPPAGRSIEDDSLALVDMLAIYTALLEYKERSGWYNMVVRPGIPERILAKGRYQIVADDPVLRPRSFAEVRRLQEAATAAVMKYAERFYHMRQERWERNNLDYPTLDKNDPNFQDYIIKIPGGEESLVLAVRKLVEECDQIYKEESSVLPNVHFDRHLYLPLLLARENKIKTEPPSLNEGEERFVRGLQEYCVGEKDRALKGKELFLLRNRSRGIGFFQTHGFYPDFILWVRSGGAQRIVFVEPHGMLYEDAPDHSEKVKLHRKMRKLTEMIVQQPGMAAVTLDSYIVSETPLEVLAQRYGGIWDRRRFAEEHILFPERNAEYDYLAEIIRGADPQ